MSAKKTSKDGDTISSDELWTALVEPERKCSTCKYHRERTLDFCWRLHSVAQAHRNRFCIDQDYSQWEWNKKDKE